MGNIRLEQDDQPTREELLKIRGKDFKPVPSEKKRAEPRATRGR